jgi:hypothetical protein
MGGRGATQSENEQRGTEGDEEGERRNHGAASAKNKPSGGVMRNERGRIETEIVASPIGSPRDHFS